MNIFNRVPSDSHEQAFFRLLQSPEDKLIIGTGKQWHMLTKLQSIYFLSYAKCIYTKFLSLSACYVYKIKTSLCIQHKKER